jgi:hypothetical protein
MDRLNDVKVLTLIFLVAFILFAWTGVFFEKMTWAEAGGIVATISVAYVGVVAGQRVLTDFANIAARK